MGCKEENADGIGDPAVGGGRWAVGDRKSEKRFDPNQKSFSDPRSLSPDPDCYPPAMAPTTRKGSAPATTASGNAVSGASWEKSCSQAKYRTKGRRRLVT